MIPGTVFRDAGIGALTGELLSAVITAIQKAAEFRSVLLSLQTTLQTIIPTVQQIQDLNEKLGRKRSEFDPLIKDIEDGVQLVRKCSKIRWYTFWKRPRYRDQLVSLDESVKEFCGKILQLQQARDIKEVLVGVNQIVARKPRGLRGYFVPEAIPNPVGFGAPLGEVKFELFKDGISLLVVSAPPGCGKTTLAKLLCNDKDVKERFKDNILFIPMSKKETMEGIVHQVFQLKDQGDPTFRSEDDARNQLEQLLHNIGPNPILLVLDDVWPESVSLLEKLKFNIPGYKILATSRSTYRNHATYKLNPLNKKDSRTLFDNSAFPSGPQSDIPEDVISQIVKECKGYPLALTIVGKSLCGLSAEEWRTRALEITRAGPVSQRDELSELYSCLQKSLDALDKTPTLKECFMDLALFSKDDLIPAAALIDMWSELYRFDEDGVKAVANLNQLSARNLADLVVTRTDAEGYNHHYVTQHDLLRELIVYQSNLEAFEQRERLIVEIFRNEVPDWWWSDKMQVLGVHCRILSISTDEKFSGNWCKIRAPKLNALVLNFRTKKSYQLPDFLTGSDGIKVLMLMNYGISPAELTNFRVLDSLPNLKKIRLDRVSIPAFLFTSLHFNTLEKITLVLCHLGQAFSPSTLLISEALPNIKEISIDYCKDLVELPLGICKLTTLKKLRLTNCHNLVAVRSEIWRLKNLEDLTLSSCIGLAELPETIGSLENLRTLDISECADVRMFPEEIGQLRNLRKIQMMGCSRNCHLPDSVQNLECLEEVGCDEDTAVLWEPFGHVLKNLKIKVRKEDINLNWLHGGRF